MTETADRRSPVFSAEAGSPLRHPLRSELRRGTGPWTGAIIAVLVVTVMAAKANETGGWQNRWTDTTDLLRVTGTFLGGPVTAALGCWHGGRERRARMTELLASCARSPLRQTLLAAAPAVVWPAVGYLAAASCCLLATWPYAGYGHPFLSLVLADAAALASLGALGFVLGRVVRWRLAAPAAAACLYLAFSFTYELQRFGWLNPSFPHDYTWDRPAWWFGPSSMLWTGGLAAASLLAYAARRRTVAIIPLALAGGAASLIVVNESPWQPDHSASRLMCDQGRPQVCVRAVDHKLLNDTSDALQDLNARLRGVPGAPLRWVDGASRPTRRDAVLPSPAAEATRNKVGDPAEYATAAAMNLFADTCSNSDFEHPDFQRTSDVNSAVIEWLAPSRIQSAILTPEAHRLVDRLRTKSREEQKVYLQRYFAADRCDPTAVPLP
ncbi:hypothetical protein ACFV28_06845 [Streptomyces sp. NPDC059720]|uniref:hypothetical protein n=1 Tax=Streptomyces sp. NPDC059720 TaxID=3346924 RepID=UPI0036AD62EB